MMRPTLSRWFTPFTVLAVLVASCGDTEGSSSDTTLTQSTGTTLSATTTDATTTTKPETTTPANQLSGNCRTGPLSVKQRP